MFDLDEEFKAANRRIQGRINDNARAAYKRIDPDCPEAAEPPTLFELIRRDLVGMWDAISSVLGKRIAEHLREEA